MGIATPSKDIMLDALSIDTIKLHSADPGADGTLNPVNGATAAVTYGNAANGERDLTAAVDVPISDAGSVVAWFSVWNTSGTVLVATKQFTGASETYANANGTARVTSAKLTVTDV